MTAREYLEGIRRRDREIDHMQKEKDYLRNKMYSLRSVTAAGEKVQSSSDPDKIGTLVSKIDEQEHLIVKAIDQLADLRKEALSLICGLKDDLEKEILISMYLDYKTMCETADLLDRSINTIRHKRKIAIQSMENTYPDLFSRQQDGSSD